ncbi:MAG: hypothetical protein JSW52_04935, partial [Candidatus Coatesbacteria bacterium]
MRRLPERYIVIATVLGLLLSSNGCELAVGPYGDLEDKVEPVLKFNENQSISRIRVATDESKLFFASFGTGHSDTPPGIRVYNLITDEVTLIYETGWDHYPSEFFVSPDESEILFLDGGNGGYYLLPTGGGEPEWLSLAPGTVQSWLYDGNLLMTNVTEGAAGDNMYEVSAFVYDFTTSEINTLCNFVVESQPEWPLRIVKLSANSDLSVAFFELIYMRFAVRQKEAILYDLTNGSYEYFPLPERAEAFGALSPNGTRILSGNRVGSSADDIGYIGVSDRWYYRVTNALLRDTAAVWNAKGDRIYFVRDDPEFYEM